MQKIIFPLAALFLILFSFQTTRAQGCSDAGFCTLSSFKPAGPAQNEPLDNQVRLGLSFGAADHDITVMGTFFEYSRQISDKWSAEAKITTLYQQNENVTAFGFSDVYLYANYAINDHFRFTLGAKLPMSDGNRLIDNTVVPMDFQSSLGTIDVLAGVAYKYNKLHVVMAFQQPVRQNNNQFLSENLVGNSVFNGFDQAF